MEEYVCRVCGFELSNPTWFSENEPSFEICLCCSVEFGIQDTHYIGVVEYRINWIKNGQEFFAKKYKPKDYNFIENYLKIPSKWR